MIWSKKLCEKEFIHKEEAAVCHKFDGGQGHLARGKRMLCVAGICSRDADTDMHPKLWLMGAAVKVCMEKKT